MNANQGIQLILLRHGNTFEKNQPPVQVGAKTDLSLTADGRKQAEKFAEHISSVSQDVKAIFAGNLSRQKETAHIIAEHCHLQDKLHLDLPALTEIDYGPWEGLTAEEIQLSWPEEYRRWTQEGHWPALFGGSLDNHLSAIEQWLKTLKNRYKSSDKVIAVTSNGIMRLFYSFQSKEWAQLQKEKQMDKIKVKTGHYCEIFVGDYSLFIQSWNRNPMTH